MEISTEIEQRIYIKILNALKVRAIQKELYDILTIKQSILPENPVLLPGATIEKN